MLNKQSFLLTSEQMKREDYEDSVPPGFSNQAKLGTIDVLASPTSNHESDEAMDFVNRSVLETREDEGEVEDTEHEIQGIDSCLGSESSYLLNELATSYDESYANEGPKTLDLDLEARISRLDNIVYVRLKALKAARSLQLNKA